jgi:hypothetical protein
MQHINKRCKLALAISSLFVLGAMQPAMADSTDDLLKKLRDKGILNEQEYNEFNNTRDTEHEQSAKEKSALNKGKIKIGKFIDNATIYGDIRARYEHRDGEDSQATPVNEDRDRGRYKMTLGIKTEASNFFYSDIAFAMGNGGRSDNATFGGARDIAAGATGAPGSNTKEVLFVKRALIGWHGVDWLTVEAGRVSNPLYTTPMVWDGDLTFEGLTERLNFTVGKAELFGNLVQTHYAGDSKQFNGAAADTASSYMFAFQGGAKFKLTDELSAKVALTYYTYTHDTSGGIFSPGLGNGTVLISGTGKALAYNDMRPIEIPFEVNYKASDNYTITGFGDFVHNLDGSDRYNAAITTGGANAAAIRAAGNDDNAWLLGIGIKSGKGVAGDWDAKIWYQDVGVYAVDPNGVDSDFMDSRVNMKGVVLKAGYNVEDNVVLNVAAGHASRKNKSLAAVGSGADLALNLDDFNLYQVDLTYKF